MSSQQMVQALLHTLLTLEFSALIASSLVESQTLSLMHSVELAQIATDTAHTLQEQSLATHWA